MRKFSIFIIILMILVSAISLGFYNSLNSNTFSNKSPELKINTAQTNIININFPYIYTVSNTSQLDNEVFSFSMAPGNAIAFEPSFVSATMSIYFSLQDAINQTNVVCQLDYYGGFISPPMLPNSNGSSISSIYYGRIYDNGGVGSKIIVDEISYDLQQESKSLNVTNEVYGTFLHKYVFLPNGSYFQPGEEIFINLEVINSNVYVDYANIYFDCWVDTKFKNSGFVNINYGNERQAGFLYTFISPATKVDVFVYNRFILSNLTSYSRYNLAYYSSTYTLSNNAPIPSTVTDTFTTTINITNYITTSINKTITRSMGSNSILTVILCSIYLIFKHKQIKKRLEKMG